MSYMETRRARHLCSFPAEIAQHALTFCHPFDVASFSRTCRKAYAIVHPPTDQYLWRHLFLSLPFDDPRESLFALRNSQGVHRFDWKLELQNRLKTESVLKAGNERYIERAESLQTLLSMIQNALPVMGGLEGQKSHDLAWVERVLRESMLLETEGVRPEINLRAKLHSYLALSLDDGLDDKTCARLKQRRLKSRCFLFDLRNYRTDNKWGPYKSEGSVNWVHVEAIINVVLMNVNELRPNPLWVETKPPTGLEATRAYSAPRSEIRKPEDWAAVEGIWMRSICFMDYRDLFAYNYATTGNGHSRRNPSFFEDNVFQEATRLIELTLKIIPEEQASSSIRERRPPGNTVDDEYPPIFFSGHQRGAHWNEATVEGCVRMGEDGAVKWQLLTVYGGLSPWSSEGIQIGNVASAAGVVGIWTGARHEQGDPVGPYWMWKVKTDAPTPTGDF